MPPFMNDPTESISSNDSPTILHPANSYRKQNSHRPQVLPGKPIMQFDEQRLRNMKSMTGTAPVDKDPKDTPLSARQDVSFRRQSSEPISPSTSKDIITGIPAVSSAPERRSIFANFWQSGKSNSPPLHRVRSQRSLSFSGTTPHLVPRPSPLMNRAISDDCWDRSPTLPELPSPLQRLQNHAGVYPLNRPKSILRNKSMLREQCQDVASVSFNLTQTLRGALKIDDQNTNQSSHSTHSSTSFESNNNNSPKPRSRHQVTFDPRVTVTELAESVGRVWYSDCELERFKAETVLLAKQYLVQHPDQIAAYSKAVTDPVTGMLRKKALFSMPILSDTSDEGLEAVEKIVSSAKQLHDSPASPSSQFFMSPRIIPRREKLPIRRILVVDRNEKIGNLFRRSLTNMFGSDCEIVTVQSAAAALQRYSGSDIIIAEERLYKPLKPTHSTSSITPPPPPPPTSLSPSESVPSHLGDTQYMSGSELFARIVADPKQKACVLIGVSTHPLEDGKRFREAGADLVWSKPPPRMDLGLRNELIALVLAKR